MFGRRITLFRLFGFAVRVDASWILLAVLVTWTLAQGFFPSSYLGLSRPAYWVMGVVGALGLFASIVFHELWHSLIARRYDLPITGITLFVFGGVAEMQGEPRDARTEFLMAAGGPVSSAILGGLFLAAGWAAWRMAWPLSVVGVLDYLGRINLVLAFFNVLPAFPLDGGRMLRAALWAWRRDVRSATRIAAAIGGGFALLLMLLGGWFLVTGDFVGGIWTILIGLFLRGAARGSQQNLIVREALAGETIRRFMRTDPVTVPPWLTLSSLVEDYFYRHQHKMYPVVDGDGRLLGCVTTTAVREVPRDEWPARRVADLLVACSPENSISPSEDALGALELMNRKSLTRLMVVEDGQLVGIVSLQDVMSFLALKIELEEPRLRWGRRRRGRGPRPAPEPEPQT